MTIHCRFSRANVCFHSYFSKSIVRNQSQIHFIAELTNFEGVDRGPYFVFRTMELLAGTSLQDLQPVFNNLISNFMQWVSLIKAIIILDFTCFSSCHPLMKKYFTLWSFLNVWVRIPTVHLISPFFQTDLFRANLYLFRNSFSFKWWNHE